MGGAAASDATADAAVAAVRNAAALTMPQKVEKVKEFLGLDASLGMGAAIKEANEMTGLASEGTMPNQVDKLMSELDL